MIFIKINININLQMIWNHNLYYINMLYNLNIINSKYPNKMININNYYYQRNKIKISYSPLSEGKN